MRPPCSSPTELARVGDLSVRACTCGSLHLDLGPFTVRMDRMAMEELSDLLVVSLRRLAMSEQAQRKTSTPTPPVHLHLVEPDVPAARRTP